MKYIQSAIKLEFGARGGICPSEPKIISPYYEQFLPELFNQSTNIKVQALVSTRTYWEKITLLHAEYHRSPNQSRPLRLFRHYYDITMLDRHKITTNALRELSLLDDVIQNKMTYFPAKWANYEMATTGNLRLYPNESFIENLKQDHRKMIDMFFGEPPDFEETLRNIKEIEKRINQAE